MLKITALEYFLPCNNYGKGLIRHFSSLSEIPRPESQ